VSSIDPLLAIEESEELLDFQLADSILLWPLIRNRLLSRARFEIEGINNPWPAVRPPAPGRLVRYVAQALHSTMPVSFPCDRPITVFTSSGACVQVAGDYWNRLADPLANCFPQSTLVLERATRFEVLRPRAYAPLRVSDGLFLPALIRGRLANPSLADQRVVRGLLAVVRGALGHTLRDERAWHALERYALRMAAAAPLYRFMFRRLFRELRSQLVLIQGSCYGGALALLTYTARESGARVAEYQHGLISRQHQAYNFGPAIAGSAYADYLPDDFLYYGRFWSTVARNPCRPVVLGNPWLSLEIDRLRRGDRIGPRTILITSSSHDPAALIRFVTSLVEGAPGRRIVLRPHPAEADVAQQRYGSLASRGVELDRAPLYDSLADADCVVGEISTTLFEALSFGIPVFCLAGGATAHHNVEGALVEVSDPAEILGALQGCGPAPPRHSAEYWASSWDENYRTYVRGILHSHTSSVPSVEARL